MESPTLMTIPPELRGMILGNVLTSSLSGPNLEDAKTHRDERRELQDQAVYGWADGQGVRYADQAYIAASTPLMLVNRQLRDEVEFVLKTLPGKHDYHLDLILLGQVEILPTWLSIPDLTDRVDRVSISVRKVDSYRAMQDLQLPHDAEDDIFPDGGMGGDQGTGLRIYWVIYGLLERFLTVGPVGSKSKPQRDRNISIRTLSIDVVSPEDEERQRLAEEAGVDGPMVAPSSFFQHLRYMMGALLALTYFTACHGVMLYEHVGEIKMSLNGRDMVTWDLAKRLAEMGYIDSFSRRPEVFYEWRRNAILKRRQTGLPVIDICEDVDMMHS